MSRPLPSFRTALGGFRKSDVLNYIDWLEQETAQRQQELRSALEAAEETARTATERATAAEADSTALREQNGQLASQLAEATEQVSFLEAARLACTQRLSAAERGLSAKTSECETLSAEAETLRQELEGSRAAATAQTEACLALLCEMQEAADDICELGRDRVDTATGQSIRCLSGLEEAMGVLLERIVTLRDSISDVRLLMENGTDGTAETFTARMAVMRERMEALKSDATARLTALSAEPTESTGSETAPAVEAAASSAPARPAPHRTTPRPEKPADMRSRLLRLLEGFLGNG